MQFYFFTIYIYNKGIGLYLNTFIIILIKSLQAFLWSGPWNPLGLFHME